MENLNPNESLKIIQTIINQRKQKYEENGFFFIFWGILVAIAGILQFLMLHFNYYPEKSGLVWAILMPLGFIFTFAAKMKKSIKAEKQGKSTDWTDWIWFFAGISAMIGGFSPILSKFLVLIIYSPMVMASLATALQLKNRLWIFTSSVSFILIYSSLYVNYGYFITFLSSLLAVLMLLIPGIKLHTDYKRNL